MAQAAERLGYDSVWATEHVLVPRDKLRYENVYEAIMTLAHLAGITRRVRLGTSILVLPQRHGVIVAKQGGDPGCPFRRPGDSWGGTGWIEGEFKNLGSDFHVEALI
jgi:hypothetical protein